MEEIAKSDIYAIFRPVVEEMSERDIHAISSPVVKKMSKDICAIFWPVVGEIF